MHTDTRSNLNSLVVKKFRRKEIYMTVNYYIKFKNPDIGAHINNVEGFSIAVLLNELILQGYLA